MRTIWDRLIFVGVLIGLAQAINEYMKRRHMLDLRGQVVLITGGSRGLGFALAQEFARQGARLIICGRQMESLEAARQQLSTMGAEVMTISCDITHQEQVQDMINLALARFDRIDILVNNAGIMTVGPQQTMALSDYEEAMNAMFWGTLYPTLAVLPHMRARKSGRIVNITSIGGKVSVPHLLPYSSAKFAAVGFSEGLHAELIEDGIHVVTVVPGLMRTGSHINVFVKGKRKAEYTWFGLLATLPITSISAACAARQIVQATRRGETEIILSLQARLLSRFHGLFPGLMTDIFGLINRFLPAASEMENIRSSGRASRTGVSTLLTGLGESAARKYNQYAWKE
jgi:short-subunit dehydrogenase